MHVPTRTRRFLGAAPALLAVALAANAASEDADPGCHPLLDVTGNPAGVKAVMSDWVDYVHLARVDGEWKFVNVLWELTPTSTAGSD